MIDTMIFCNIAPHSNLASDDFDMRPFIFFLAFVSWPITVPQYMYISMCTGHYYKLASAGLVLNDIPVAMQTYQPSNLMPCLVCTNEISIFSLRFLFFFFVLLGSNVKFPCFSLIVIHEHTKQQRKNI